MHLGGAISSYTLKSHVQDPPASEEQLLQDPQCLPILETLQTVQLHLQEGDDSSDGPLSKWGRLKINSRQRQVNLM